LRSACVGRAGKALNLSALINDHCLTLIVLQSRPLTGLQGQAVHCDDTFRNVVSLK
jgi:hypothetical protein